MNELAKNMIFYTLKGDDVKVYIDFVDTDPKSPEIELYLFERSYTATEKGAGKRGLLKALLLLREQLPHKTTVTLGAVPHSNRSKTLEEKKSAQQRLNAYYTNLGFEQTGKPSENLFEANINELIEKMSVGGTRRKRKRKRTRRFR